ncbi:hypothetical protein FOA52_016126 [Chlamydomonas sp. UWO 241]|nr:hypothetical protein FOA52_016126 [Chlamydomonas sp. UWO 241]
MDTDTDDEGTRIKAAAELHKRQASRPSEPPEPPARVARAPRPQPAPPPPPPLASVSARSAAVAAPAGARAAPRRPAGAITMRQLIASGFLEPGVQVVYVEYKGATTHGDLTEAGHIKCNGLTFESPSAFSIYIKRLVNPTRKADDGWKAVKYAGKLLEHYKDEYLRNKYAAALAESVSGAGAGTGTGTGTGTGEGAAGVRAGGVGTGAGAAGVRAGGAGAGAGTGAGAAGVRAGGAGTGAGAAGETDAYYGRTYWNNLAQVRDHINTIATGDPTHEWYHHLKEWRGKPFQRALIFNCGNGWVERVLWQEKIIVSGLGLDLLEPFVREAQSEANKLGANLTYVKHDINSDDLPPGPFDLIVNVAAAHHISRIDKVFNSLRQRLEPGGLFVSWDYVGPHRNQYPENQWRMMSMVNTKLLPAELPQDMRYPHMPNMLADDPSEAVHSELFNNTLRRYLDVVWWRSVGGAIAYPLITHNDNFFSKRTVDDATLQRYVAMLLEMDYAWTQKTGATLFAYVIASPKQDVDLRQVAGALTREDAREARAHANGGVYYRPTSVAWRLHMHAQVGRARARDATARGVLAACTVAAVMIIVAVVCLRRGGRCCGSVDRRRFEALAF